MTLIKVISGGQRGADQAGPGAGPECGAVGATAAGGHSWLERAGHDQPQARAVGGTWIEPSWNPG